MEKQIAPNTMARAWVKVDGEWKWLPNHPECFQAPVNAWVEVEKHPCGFRQRFIVVTLADGTERRVHGNACDILPAYTDIVAPHALWDLWCGAQAKMKALGFAVTHLHGLRHMTFKSTASLAVSSRGDYKHSPFSGAGGRRCILIPSATAGGTEDRARYLEATTSYSCRCLWKPPRYARDAL